MPLDILVTRDIRGQGFTLSTISVRYSPGDPWLDFGFACEDVDRGLDSSMSLSEIAAKKVKGQTAIPTGTYELGWHQRPNGDIRLHVENVPGFQWILVHPGNDPSDSEGCILPGLARDIAKGTVSKSKLAVAWLEKEARAKGAGTITIVREG